MYKIVFNDHLCHMNYTIDDDGRFHSTSDGKFVSKGGRVSPDQLSNDELTRVTRRQKLEESYDKYYPSRMKSISEALDATSRGFNSAANATRSIKLKEKKRPRADLSNLSDKELDAILRREEMEQRYDRYFNAPVENKGQKFVDNLTKVLTIAGGVVGLAVGVVTIADKVKKD